MRGTAGSTATATATAPACRRAATTRAVTIARPSVSLSARHLAPRLLPPSSCHQAPQLPSHPPPSSGLTDEKARGPPSPGAASESPAARQHAEEPAVSDHGEEAAAVAARYTGPEEEADQLGAVI